MISPISPTLVLAMLLPTLASAQTGLEGKWLGKAGTVLDRIDVGFEFKRDSSGQVAAYLYQPVGNYYGMPIGTVTSDSGRFQIRSWAIGFTLPPDSLVGLMFFTRQPFVLARTTRLPAEVPVPKT
jgi:hypothetical protein